MEKAKEVQFKLARVKEISFLCTDFITDLSNNDIEKKLKIEIGFNIELLTGKDEIGIRTIIKYLFMGDEVLKYENQIDFDVKKLEQVANLEKDNFNIKDEFFLSLLSVVIGTTRGMMIKNTMGKRINDFPLPILNPKDILDSLKTKETK